MYQSSEVLAALDRNAVAVIALCGFAMICNYTWFFAAVWRGFRDQVVPIPVFCTLFWLSGDGSMVARFDLWFNVIDHWYVKLFWAALCLTVMTEIVFLYMTLRFGRKELAPNLSQSQFAVVVLVGLGVFILCWEYIKRLIGDELYIDYFHLANMAGPVFAAAQYLRRGTRAGTSTLIWGAYTLMVASWFTACALYFGGPFASPLYLGFYAVCVCAAAAMTIYVARLPVPSAPAAAPPAAAVTRAA